MFPFKSPGPDGMSPVFFQTFWNIVGSDVSNSVLRILNEHALLYKMNHTHVVLIPKCDNPKTASQLRPISLCNVVLKIASKCLANRLKPLMNSIVSQSQSAFIPDKLITDNVLLAFELNHFLKVSNRSKKAFAALKLDMSKAYDRVEWSFLKRVLLRLGFESELVELVMLLVTTVSYSLTIEGIPFGSFVMSDPASGYAGVLQGIREAPVGSRPSLTWRSILLARGVLRVGCEARTTTVNPDDGRVVWKQSKKGLFSVRSAYEVITEMDAHLDASSSRQFPFLAEGCDKFWQRLWRLKAPPRVRVQAWRFCHEAIPTMDNLAKQHQGVDSSCALCGLWKQLNMFCGNVTLLEWCGHYLIFQWVCWTCGQKNRNKKRTEGLEQEPLKVITDAPSLLAQYQEV
ncbi:UNVERIFIED_CONTAM: LINE-1 reverse transcriptase [Sesamum latifolium]|uniref:LINE-1 reverse transcriptase n=1 Tax=Sesamum latifolium TaxID=2727402 RepID=A0AAW2VUI3_9LAMI